VLPVPLLLLRVVLCLLPVLLRAALPAPGAALLLVPVRPRA
jgi:hypothetical protein